MLCFFQNLQSFLLPAEFLIKSSQEEQVGRILRLELRSPFDFLKGRKVFARKEIFAREQIVIGASVLRVARNMGKRLMTQVTSFCRRQTSASGNRMPGSEGKSCCALPRKISADFSRVRERKVFPIARSNAGRWPNCLALLSAKRNASSSRPASR